MNTHHTTVTTITDLELRTVPAGVALSTYQEAADRAEEIRGHLALGFGKLTVAREKRDDIALGYGLMGDYVRANSAPWTPSASPPRNAAT
jgi:hypothetical protein